MVCRGRGPRHPVPRAGPDRSLTGDREPVQSAHGRIPERGPADDDGRPHPAACRVARRGPGLVGAPDRADRVDAVDAARCPVLVPAFGVGQRRCQAQSRGAAWCFPFPSEESASGGLMGSPLRSGPGQQACVLPVMYVVRLCSSLRTERQQVLCVREGLNDFLGCVEMLGVFSCSHWWNRRCRT